MQACSTLIVKKNDLRKIRMLPGAVDGATVLRVDRFAMTANTITYGAFGDAMSYWRFFPVAEEGWGCIPVWGFGTVLQSSVSGVAAGERFYGYFPMASHVALQPASVDDAGFVDGAAHRSELHPLYNQYTRNSTDSLYRAADEDVLMLLRPLFLTSFVIDDLLADNRFFGTRTVLLSSASSKTAYGTAFQLAQRQGIEVIGLTSRGNVDFVTSLGCYQRVLPYDEATSMPADLPVTYVDMTGNMQLRAALHHHFGDAMRYSCAVGATNWDKMQRADVAPPLPGVRSTLFFAPAQIDKRAADWGPGVFRKRFEAAWHGFIAKVTNPAQPWLNVTHGQGPEAAERVYRELVDGRIDPRRGHLFSIGT